MSERTRIVCFGELLVRLSSPDGEQLLQSPSLNVHFGGAEANVAVSLARFGHDAAMVSIVPPNALGASAVAELRRHGVSTSRIIEGPGRLGLYFLTPGAVARPSAVLYDRAGSSFALAAPTAIDWALALRGAR
jgi:2-dehydro-3-deoxygluconokinase